MSHATRITLAATLLTLAAAPLAAQRRPVVVHPKARVVHPRARIVFRTNDRGIFRGYFRTHRIVVTPLRAELARLVIVGKPLPVEIVRTPIPADLVVLLAPPPAGYRYLIVGNRIVIVDNDGMVDDILDDVFEAPQE